MKITHVALGAPRRVALTVTGTPGGADWAAFWGDGDLDAGIADGDTAVHDYPHAGVWSLAVKIHGRTVATNWMIVRPEPKVGIELRQDPEDLAVVHLVCTEPAGAPVSRYEIQWRDGASDTLPLIGGQRVSHRYRPGRYEVGVYAMDERRRAQIIVTVPEPAADDPGFSLGADGHTVTLTVTAADATRQAVVSFGDHDVPIRGALHVGDMLTHVYRGTAVAGLRIVQAGYDGADRTTAKTITIGGTS